MIGRKALLLLLVACAKQQEAPPPAAPVATTTTAAPAPAPVATAAPATPAAIATAEGEKRGLSVAVTELKRTSGGTLSLKLTFINGSGDIMGFDYNYVEANNGTIDFGSIGGVQLIDPVGKKKYFVARDSEGRCICSQGLRDAAAGESVNVWAKFPAPPDDVTKISVVIPHFSPMDDVPISK